MPLPLQSSRIRQQADVSTILVTNQSLPDEGLLDTRITILLVDDDSAIRRLGEIFLEQAGYKVLSANDGPSALQLYREEFDQIDVIILDQNMPTMSGSETLRCLRSVRPDVRVVLSSGYRREDAAREFAGMGLAGFLEKPYGPRQVKDAVELALANVRHD